VYNNEAEKGEALSGELIKIILSIKFNYSYGIFAIAFNKSIPPISSAMKVID